MRKSEELAKLDLINKGYRVWRKGDNGMPDFECRVGNNSFYVEVKSGNDGLALNQLKKITELLQRGNKIFLFYYNGKSFDTYQITTFLKPFVLEKKQYYNSSKIYKIHKAKCNKCGKLIEGISEKEVNAWLEQHKHYVHENNEKKLAI